jgi:hypothetical protein
MYKTMDLFLQKFQHWLRSIPFLYRFTLGTRTLLAIGFIPTGMVKLLGYRFTNMSVESDLGAFFEILYQTQPYWQFLGFTQVLAGILVLIPATAALGALLFLGIMVNIFIITLSYYFAYTPVITFLMLLATIWLILWDYHRFRRLIFNSPPIFDDPKNTHYQGTLPDPALANVYERFTYFLGTISGLLFFGMLRGLVLPEGFEFVLLFVCLICFLAAIIFAIRYARK